MQFTSSFGSIIVALIAAVLTYLGVSHLGRLNENFSRVLGLLFGVAIFVAALLYKLNTDRDVIVDVACLVAPGAKACAAGEELGDGESQLTTEAHQASSEVNGRETADQSSAQPPAQEELARSSESVPAQREEVTQAERDAEQDGPEDELPPPNRHTTNLLSANAASFDVGAVPFSYGDTIVVRQGSSRNFFSGQTYGASMRVRSNGSPSNVDVRIELAIDFRERDSVHRFTLNMTNGESISAEIRRPGASNYPELHFNGRENDICEVVFSQRCDLQHLTFQVRGREVRLYLNGEIFNSAVLRQAGGISSVEIAGLNQHTAIYSIELYEPFILPNGRPIGGRCAIRYQDFLALDDEKSFATTEDASWCSWRYGDQSVAAAEAAVLANCREGSGGRECFVMPQIQQ